MTTPATAARLWWTNTAGQVRNLANHAEQLLAQADAGQPLPFDRDALKSIYVGLENALSRILSSIPEPEPTPEA